MEFLLPAKHPMETQIIACMPKVRKMARNIAYRSGRGRQEDWVDELEAAGYKAVVEAASRDKGGDFIPYAMCYARGAMLSANREMIRIISGSGEGAKEGWRDDPKVLPSVVDETPPYDDARDDTMAHALSEALEALPERQRQAVVMHHMNGMSCPEAAVAMGTTANNVAQLAYRGIAKLRQALRCHRGRVERAH